ncbi:MAG: integrase core domain-containing protein [Pseudomonadota bacterium]
MVAIRTIIQLLRDLATFIWLTLRPPGTLAAENLFLRKQLAMYQERGQKPRRPDQAIRVTLVQLSRLFDWKDALVVVQPQTLVRWHRQGFRLFWRWKSRPGRPPIPQELRILIREMALSNPIWGEERIANELLLKLGIRVSPRTVRKYMPVRPSIDPRSDQRWSTFVRNHAAAILACDFCVVVTATFRLLYVFVIIEHQTRRIVHCNVTTNPTAAWTLQQLREAIPSDHDYRLLIHDRDSIFSSHLDQSISNLGVRVLRTPPRCPQGNSICERVIGTLRRECLDFMIPLTENHLRTVLKQWVTHYNRGRPHSSLGPGLPDPPFGLAVSPHQQRHLIPDHFLVGSRPILGGLHHEYDLVPMTV